MLPSRSIIALVAIVTFSAALAAEETRKEKNEFKLTKEEQEVLDLTNKVRKDAGLSELTPSEKLFKAARDHSANMAAKNRIGHILDGYGPGERLASAGYASVGWAENCAAGQQTAAEAVQSWLNSKGHRANLYSRHAEIGIGVAAAANGTLYWTQVFANPG